MRKTLLLLLIVFLGLRHTVPRRSKAFMSAAVAMAAVITASIADTVFLLLRAPLLCAHHLQHGLLRLSRHVLRTVPSMSSMTHPHRRPHLRPHPPRLRHPSPLNPRHPIRFPTDSISAPSLSNRPGAALSSTAPPKHRNRSSTIPILAKPFAFRPSRTHCRSTKIMPEDDRKNRSPPGWLRENFSPLIGAVNSSGAVRVRRNGLYHLIS